MMIDYDQVKIEYWQPHSGREKPMWHQDDTLQQLFYSPINFDEQILQSQFEKGAMTRCPDHKIHCTRQPAWMRKDAESGSGWKELQGP